MVHNPIRGQHRLRLVNRLGIKTRLRTNLDSPPPHHKHRHPPNRQIRQLARKPDPKCPHHQLAPTNKLNPLLRHKQRSNLDLQRGRMEQLPVLLSRQRQRPPRLKQPHLLPTKHILPNNPLPLRRALTNHIRRPALADIRVSVHGRDRGIQRRHGARGWGGFHRLWVFGRGDG